MSNSTAATTGHLCICGCSQIITSKATYKPGHDAAHVSFLLQGLLNEEADQGRAAVTTALIRGEAKNLPSEALQAKFLRAAERLFAAKAPKAPKAKREVVEILDSGTVKVGRWEYPAREIKYSDDTSLVQRNEKRDGSGVWIDIAA